MPLQEVVEQFRSEFRGTLIEPHNALYHDTRKVYNAMIDRNPRLIARCSCVADGLAAVKLAHAGELTVSIRSGGHNAAGLGICDADG